MNTYKTLKIFPPKADIETKQILKLASKAHRNLGELKGIIKSVPNENVLLNLLPLQEARFSSEIENIITTDDDIFTSKIESGITSNAKEVRNYEKALIEGFEAVKLKKILSNNMICEIVRTIKQNTAGFRTQSGTTLKNNIGETIYIPPQHANEVQDLMNDLEKFINTDDDGLDPLVKMALIHHQFESIHPFYDGNGRAGRIINILFLCLKDILDLPILYLSRYIIKNKSDYYRLLQEVRTKDKWQEWIIWMIGGVGITALETKIFIERMMKLMQEYKHLIRKEYPKIYSQDLINSLFKYPYTKIEHLQKDLNIHRQTAKKYLDILDKENLLEKIKIGKSNYYINQKLIDTAIEHREWVEKLL